MNGDEAVAFAAKQANPDVIAAYPITPQTIIVERLSEYVANGEIPTEYICTESEHSALSACVGASLAGGRVFTATSSQGLALMHEVLYLASGLRLPIVMAVANRALSAPINIHNDHSDMMGSRDSGWVQFWAENAQEAYDWTLMAFKLAEAHGVNLPIAVNLDGFTITHSAEDFRVLEDREATAFLPPRVPSFKLDPKSPITVGALTLPDYYFEIKRQQEEAMRNAANVFPNVTQEYEAISGREYAALDLYQMDDADVALVCLGSVAGTAKHVIRELRASGLRAGLVKPWLYRPFPTDQLLDAVRNMRALAVMDRAVSFGAPYGPLCSDVISALYNNHKTPVVNVIAGLGGRDITPEQIKDIFRSTERLAKGESTDPVVFVGVRE
jgi:pyruvate ferredoxin oxidoreductase alpha subunit